MMPEWKFQWDFLSVLALFLIVAGMALTFIFGRKASNILRLLGVGFLVFSVLEPQAFWTKNKAQRPELAILVDQSESMSLGGTNSRFQEAIETIKKAVPVLDKKFNLKFFVFDSAVRPTTLKDLENSPPPKGARSSIYESVASIGEDLAVDGILLFSDGAENTLNSKSQASLTKQIYTVGTVQEKQWQDLALKNLRGSNFAFKNRWVNVSVELWQQNFYGQNVQVSLEEQINNGWKILESKQIQIKENAGKKNLEFGFVPQSVGLKKCRLKVTRLSDEVSYSNNELFFEIEVGREKIRVLYLCGRPNPEYSFLRHLLKTDPSIELVSFVILRNPESVVPVGDHQLSLIPFPAQDIFVKTLYGFDLLIFENFSYSRLGINKEHLENIAKFVEENGGAFIMIGGENSFGYGGYAGTAIERILPVQLSQSQEKIIDRSLEIEPSEWDHPLFDLGETMTERKLLWKNLPHLKGQHTLIPKQNAEVLARHTQDQSPVWIYSKKGKGKVLALGSLSTWQWALGESTQAESLKLYTRFWRHVMRWLVSEEDADPIRILFDQPILSAHEKNRIRAVTSFNSSVQDNVTVHGQVHSVGSSDTALTFFKRNETEYESTWETASAGDYTVTVYAKAGKREWVKKQKISVQEQNLELKNPYPNKELLKKIAVQSGATYWDADEFDPERIQLNKQQRDSKDEIREISFAQRWDLFLFALLCFILAWINDRKD